MLARFKRLLLRRNFRVSFSVILAIHAFSEPSPRYVKLFREVKIFMNASCNTSLISSSSVM